MDLAGISQVQLLVAIDGSLQRFEVDTLHVIRVWCHVAVQEVGFPSVTTGRNIRNTSRYATEH